LNWHVPAPELHHFSARVEVSLVQYGFFFVVGWDSLLNINSLALILQHKEKLTVPID
jgi:hypothetical protein